MWWKAGRLRDAPFLCAAQVFCVHVVEEIGVYTIFCRLCIVVSVHTWEEMGIWIKEISVEQMGLYLVVWGYVSWSDSKSMKIQKINSIFMWGSQFPITILQIHLYKNEGKWLKNEQTLEDMLGHRFPLCCYLFITGVILISCVVHLAIA